MLQRAARILARIGIFTFAIASVSEASDRWKERKAKVGDIEVRYLEAGDGDRIIVFLTGWMLPGEVWKEQIPYFTSRGFRVIAPDPRGQGRTTQTETGNTYRQHAADLYAFLLEVRAEHCFLVAWDSAVNTVLEYVSSPDSIRPNKIVLVGGYPHALEKDDYPGAITQSKIRSQFYEIQENRGKFTEKYIQNLFEQPQEASFLKDLKKSALKTPFGAAMSLFFDLVTGDRLPALSRISVPTLIVSTPVNRPIGEYMQSKISRSELTVIEGAGTALFLDKPQAFNQILEEFIGEY